MPSATASGSDAQSGGGGSSEKRKCTPEQAAAVRRIKACGPTAFYDILGIESISKSCSDSDIKKAYRKQSLLTHPDKNSHEHAVQAFQMVSRAFDVLGTPDKRAHFDRHGTDPSSRFANAQAQNPFNSFASRAGGAGPRGGGMFDDEISPEEIFQRFFGGGGGGGFGGPFGGFDTGPQFVFNFGGGPGVRVHQFGGGRPRTRTRGAQQQQTQGTNATSMLSSLLGVLPILLLFIFPIISSLFSNGFSTEAAMPRMVFDNAQPPLTAERTTPRYGVHYFVNPTVAEEWSTRKLTELDKRAEVFFINTMRGRCENEHLGKQRLEEAAQGWFTIDEAKMQKAREHPMPSCVRLKSLGVIR